MPFHGPQIDLSVRDAGGLLPPELLTRSVRTPNGCLIWTGARSKNGYGQKRWGGRVDYLHRIVWRRMHGPIPVGMEVCHNCPGGDNPACWEPSHLFLGSHAANMADASRKGRIHAPPIATISRGERHYRARLTATLVVQLRRRYRAGEQQKAMARELGISNCTVQNAIHGITWAHVKEGLDV